MIKSRLLSNFKNISHGFFNSEGGYSNGIYKSLNCGIGSKDKKRRVLLNLKKVSKKIKVANNNLVLLNQIHSNRVKFVNKNKINRFVGDSLVTNKKNLALGILTADCAPVLIFDPKKQNIAALHAGWKGAYKNIIKNTLKKLIEKGSKTRDLIAVIGPCRSIENYEVRKDFLNKFVKKSIQNKKYFKYYNDKIFFSLNSYIKSQLKKCNVKKIEIINKDTYPKKNKFFSSRRSINEKFNDYGRNISVIMIK